jgi:predicted nuclease with TOPRIM domain
VSTESAHNNDALRDLKRRVIYIKERLKELSAEKDRLNAELKRLQPQLQAQAKK